MKITKIAKNEYRISNISVAEVLEMVQEMNSQKLSFTSYICYAIRARAIEKIRRKGAVNAVEYITELFPQDSRQMSIDVIRSVMAHYHADMSPNVKRTFAARSNCRIEQWSPTISWKNFMKQFQGGTFHSKYYGLSGFSCGSLHVDLYSKNGLTCGKANDMTTYSMVKKRYSTDGSRMVKRGACRRELAEATSQDGQSWRVRPLERGWQR